MRLRRSTPDKPGLTRRRRGKGFTYLDTERKRITDPDVIERIRTLAIPPAWKDVWICPYPNGHIQAIGTDEAGRRQYLYHDDWRTSQDADKHDRVRRLARKLPAFREAVDQDLCRQGFGRDKVLAVALRMLDYGVFRTGNTQYAEEYGSRGASTLLRDDVKVSKGRLVFDFVAKGGIRRTLELEDDRLVAAVRSLKRARHDSPRLLVYRDDAGYHEIDATMVNERFHELVGDDYTVKDLRTWTATVHAAVDLAQADPPRTKKALNEAVKEMLAEVSEHLGNTPTVARASYVDPRVVEQYERGRTIASTVEKVGDDLDDAGVRAQVERSVNKLLDQDAR
ncbi:DNA topoisomerase, type I, putative [Kribbella flavida DSM 17836]|uniref:DNA topoisomerase n=1 Tax=Kribbella flavida (strain DSM 17836 / JCM 10339 / NBRC 14399) TaxID=479435 RepID=D2Q012_KRIFD|nr:DNA topoisomerase IB [Kribbella flavida]ADB30010.1 DNA topoisomerase, type I, putative [Kribbella flavida DSM 17836]